MTGKRGSHYKILERVQRIATVTPPSLLALKDYLEGEAALRRGHFEQALADFESAVAKDPSFALAYYRMSTAAEWLLQAELAHRAAEEAYRHAGRLSELDRRLLEDLPGLPQWSHRRSGAPVPGDRGKLPRRPGGVVPAGGGLVSLQPPAGTPPR